MTSSTDAPTNGNGTPTGQALERTTPAQMVTQYKDSLSAVLPSHITKPETWLRIAQSALKKGPRGQDGRTSLEVAAENNPAVFMATLIDCARLGLEPGTEQYYLTPRRAKGGRTEILGIVGYQGYIELMYRAGAVESVVAECVYERDVFAFRPGVDVLPQHEIDWDSDDRGALRLVYAFARMKGGAVSKVVVLNKADIARIKAKAQDPGGQYSPWRTDEPSMWLKSAVRQLRKWVPTSAEYRREQLRAEAEVAEQRAALADHGFGQDLPPVNNLDHDVVDVDEVHDDDIEDAVVIEPEDAPPTHGAGEGEGEEAPVAGPAASPPEPSTTDDHDDFPDLPQAEPEREREPEPEPESNEHERRGAVGVTDIARYARQVFKADYDAAPNGQKTRVVERLRHAVVYAQSGGKTVTLNDLEPEDLLRVNNRLRDIAGGRLVYEVTDTGVAFSYKGSEKRTPEIQWAQLEELETAGAAT